MSVVLNCSCSLYWLQNHVVYFRVNDEDVRLMLWDTAGQEEFDAITKAYYRGENTIFVIWQLGFLWVWGFFLVCTSLKIFSYLCIKNFSYFMCVQGIFSSPFSVLKYFSPSCKILALVKCHFVQDAQSCPFKNVEQNETNTCTETAQSVAIQTIKHKIIFFPLKVFSYFCKTHICKCSNNYGWGT